MIVLVLGSGGREHVMAQALARDSQVQHTYVAPGDQHIAQDPQLTRHVTCVDIDMFDAEAVVGLARQIDAAIVWIGSATAMANGVSDALRRAGFNVFGASSGAAYIEVVKSYARELMAALDIPAPMGFWCTTPEQIDHALDIFGPPYVLTDNVLRPDTSPTRTGLVTDNRSEAEQYAHTCLAQPGRFTAEPAVLVDEYILGEHITFSYMCDGRSVAPLIPVNTHYDPATPYPAVLPEVSGDMYDAVTERVVRPLMQELYRRHTPLIGPLSVKTIIGPRGLRVVGFDVHIEQAEGQLVLALLRNQISDVLRNCLHGSARNLRMNWAKPQATGITGSNQSINAVMPRSELKY
ncbi:MAG: hypothetical protein GX483_03580 [Actinomycetaceae bacterium]|nr:hypothetical protein [Actinomycetaceae bacterium]